MLSVVGDVPVDSETPVVTSSISRFVSSFWFVEGTHRGRVCGEYLCPSHKKNSWTSKESSVSRRASPQYSTTKACTCKIERQKTTNPKKRSPVSLAQILWPCHVRPYIWCLAQAWHTQLWSIFRIDRAILKGTTDTAGWASLQPASEATPPWP